MKKYFIIQMICFGIFISLQFSCTKDPYTPTFTQQPLPPPPPPTPPTQPPLSPFIVLAGPDVTIELPIDSALLLGKTYSGSDNVFRYYWEKIYGPNGGTVAQPDSVRNVLKNLQIGVYTYVITATNQAGTQDTDTINLVVEGRSSAIKKVRFSNTEWECDWSCGIIIDELKFYTGAAPYNIFIRREGFTVWDPVQNSSAGIPGRYYYDASSPLFIYIWEDPDITVWDRPDIKVEF